MQNKMINNLIYIGVPLDAVIVSGLTDETPVEISATNGKIVIEAINNIYLCDECRAKVESEETEVEEWQYTES